MSNTGKIYEVKCPSCGAPLSMTGERITCDYCGAVLERERPTAPKQSTFSKPQEPQVIVIQSGYSTTSVRRKSGGSSCLSALFTLVLILGIVGAVIWFQFRNQLASLTGLTNLAQIADLSQLEKLANTVSVTAVSKLMLVPGYKEGAPDFLTYAYKLDASTYSLTYVDAVSSTIRWQSPPLKEYYATQVIPAATAVYLNDETRLMALNRADGQVLWQTSMADKLTSGCTNCFQLVDQTLVVLLQGGTVQGFNTVSGQLLWTNRLNFESGGRVMQADKQLLIFDRTEDNRNNLMLVVNPANGEAITELTIPACAGEMFDLHYPVRYDENRGQLYLISGDIIGPACVQIWDIAGQTMTREVIFEGFSLPSQFTEYVSEQSKVLLAGDQLYFSANQGSAGSGSGGGVIALNVVDGTWQLLAPSPDYDFTPLTANADLLIVQAVRTRGTPRQELWGLDPASGESRWQYVLQAGRWFKKTGAEPAWDWHLTPTGLAILQIFDNPDQLTIEVLNPQTGVSSGQKTITVEDSFLSDIAWTNDAVWLTLRKIYKVDLATGTVSYTWP